MKIPSPPRHFAWVVLIVLVNVSPAWAQGRSDLQHQVDELKQQYERMTAELQRRIVALGQQLERQNSDGRGKERDGEGLRSWTC